MTILQGLGLTATFNRRLSHGLSVGAAYTFSKAMGTTT